MMQPIQPPFSRSSTFVNANETIASTSATSSVASFPYVTHIGNAEEQLFTLPYSYSIESQVHSSYNERQAQEFRFQIIREPIYDEIWHSFKQLNDKSNFIERYNDFLCSNWEPSEGYKLSLKVAQGSITRSQNSSREKMVQLYDTLVDVFFYTDLRCKASYLIKSILELYKNHLIINNPRTFGKNRAKEAQVKIIDEINNHYDYVYNTVYLKFICYRDVSDENKKLSDIIKLKNELQNLRTYTVKYKKGIAIMGSPHLPLINYILDTLQNSQKVTYQEVIALLTNRMPNHEITQPPQKKRRQDLDSYEQLSQPEYNSEAIDASVFQDSIEPYSLAEFLPWEAQQVISADKIEVDTNDPRYKAILEDLRSCEPSTSAQSRYSAQSRCEQNEVLDTFFAPTLQQEAPVFEQSTLAEDVQPKMPIIKPSLLHSLYTLDIYQTQLLYATSPLSEEDMLVSLLKKIVKQEAYFYDSTKVFNDDSNIHPAKYYHAFLMRAALNCEVLSLRMKVMIGELIDCEKVKDSLEISNVRRRMTRCLVSLGKNHKIHQKIELMLQNETLNDPSQGMLLESIKSIFDDICYDIRNVQTLLTKTQFTYTQANKGNYEKNIFERLQALGNERITMVSIRKNFSLSRTQIKQLIQGTFSMQFDLNLTEEQLSLLKFKIARDPVDKEFWESLKVEKDQFSFRKYYFDFIFTSWENPAYVNDHVDMKISIAKKSGDKIYWCKLLVERCFQEKMRSQAFHLLHYILNVIKFSILLKNFPKICAAKTNIERTITLNINKIMNNSSLTYKIYLAYLMDRKKTPVNKISNLYNELESTPRYIYNNMSADNRETSKHILLINRILEELEKKEPIDPDLLLDITIEGTKDIENTSQTIPTHSHALENDVPSNAAQLQFAPSIFEQPLPQYTEKHIEKHSDINFVPQFSVSQPLANEEGFHNLIDMQETDKLLECIFEPTEPDINLQIEGHLDMDENHLLDIFSD